MAADSKHMNRRRPSTLAGFLAIAALILALGGCGQKGPLYLPGKAPGTAAAR
jgi:predicted small lipoprotein YifL